ncbi:MAG: 50S ribosomal protein L30e [Candidatus Altiarchaeales archaeon A3]|nr:MAG: 50S ribosomal protein L30e [Candidatus Altiarchaeales archaeon A3]
MDLKTALSVCVKTGKTYLGKKETMRVLLTGNPKKVIISNDCKDKNRIEYYCKLSGTDYIGVNLSSLTLGEYCGKPFPISSLTIINPGDSNILEIKE